MLKREKTLSLEFRTTNYAVAFNVLLAVVKIVFLKNERHTNYRFVLRRMSRRNAAPLN